MVLVFDTQSSKRETVKAMMFNPQSLRLTRVGGEYQMPLVEWAELDPKSGFIFSINLTGRGEFEKDEVRFGLWWKDMGDEGDFGRFLFSVRARESKDQDGNFTFILDLENYREAVDRLYGDSRTIFESALNQVAAEKALLEFFCVGWQLVARSATFSDKEVVVEANLGESNEL